MAGNTVARTRRLAIERLEQRLALSGSGITGQYFHNSDFTGLAETRIEAISFRWGASGPVAGVDGDTFSVRWTGQIEPAFSEAYVFTLHADEKARVWLDGQLILDAWSGPVRSLQSDPVALIAGERYDLRIDLIENTGTSFIDLLWSSASQSIEIVPQEALYESPLGLLASYADASGGAVTRVDPNVDYFFGPRGPAGLDSDNFTITWTGQLRPDFSEQYTFSTISDERVRLWVGNELVIDHWDAHAVTEDIGSKWLEAGKWYDVRLEYAEVSGSAEIAWRWSSARQTADAFEVVPTDNLRATHRPLTTFSNPLGNGFDPFVIRHEEQYYLTRAVGSTIRINRADLLENIHATHPASDVLTVWTAPGGTDYSHEIWAPELHRLDGKWYIYFAASDGQNENHRMHVLERDAADPFGPFTYKGEIQVPTDRWAIDGTVLEWGGKTYFIWSGWSGFSNGQQNLYIAEMANPWTLATDRHLLATPQYAWERHGLPINEGPQILIHDGNLHIIYSGSGFWTHNYALGRLTYDGSGSLLNSNSWTKAPAPVFAPTEDVVGTGHASFTVSPGEDEHWIVFHAHTDPEDAARMVHIQPFWFRSDGTPDFGSPAPLGTKLPTPSNGPDPERPDLVGDYNADGVVGQSDYDTWRATIGTSIFPGTGADGNGNGAIDAADYVTWRRNQGMVAAAVEVAQFSVSAPTPMPQQTETEESISLQSASPVRIEVPAERPTRPDVPAAPIAARVDVQHGPRQPDQRLLLARDAALERWMPPSAWSPAALDDRPTRGTSPAHAEEWASAELELPGWDWLDVEML